VTGAEFIAKDLGMKVESSVVEQLGTARKVTVASTSTTLIADAASKDEIEMRIAQLKKELSETDSGGRLWGAGGRDRGRGVGVGFSGVLHVMPAT
jgi:hypothetical protein